MRYVPDQGPSSPYAGIEVTIDHPADYVLGFPMHLAVTVSLAQGVMVAGLSDLSVYQAPQITCKMTHKSTGETQARGAASNGPMDAHIVGYALEAGGRRRMLVDLSDLDLSTLKEGLTVVEISYLGASAPPFEVTLHAPTPEQKIMLDKLHPEIDDAGSWGRWAMFPARKPGSVTATVSRTDPLRYCRVLRYLFNGPGTVSSIPSSVLDALDGLYAPEAQLLRAELAWIRKDKAGYAREAGKVKAKYPELVHGLQEIEAGGSLIQTTREQNAIMFGH